MATDPVLMHLANARAAARRHGVRVEHILGILAVEGGTDAQGRPVEPQDGAGPPSFGQFTFGTGRALGVRYGNSSSETDAIARYLNQLGYQRDPDRAIGAYNGGPKNPRPEYLAKVVTAAKRYSGAGGDAPQSVLERAGTRPDPNTQDRGNGALHALLWVATVGAGAVVAGLGFSKMIGATNTRAATA